MIDFGNAHLAFIAVISVVGIIANSMSFTLMMRKRFRNTSIGMLLATLAIFDTLSLLTGGLITLDLDPFNYQITRSNNIACKILNSGCYIFLAVSAYVLCAITIERCYITVNPYKPKPTRRQALICISLIVGLSFACYAPMSIVYGVYDVGKLTGFNGSSIINTSAGSLGSEISTDFSIYITPTVPSVFNSSLAHNNNDGGWNKTDAAGPQKMICKVQPRYQSIHDKYIVIVDSIIVTFIPLLTVICANAVLITQLFKQRKGLALKDAGQQRDNKIERAVTRMLVTASVFYVCTTLPASLYVCFVSPTLVDFNNPIWVVLVDLFLLNFALNFFVYIISGKTFREELKNLYFELRGIQPGGQIVQSTRASQRLGLKQIAREGSKK